MDIYFVARNEVSVRQFNRRSVSAQCSPIVNRLPPSVFGRHTAQLLSHCFTDRTIGFFAVGIMIKLVVRLCGRRMLVATQRVHLTTCPSSTTWQMQSGLPSHRPSVRPPASCSACRHPPRLPPVACAVSASPIDRPSSVRQYQVASQIPAETQLRIIVCCSHGLASTSAAAT